MMMASRGLLCQRALPKLLRGLGVERQLAFISAGSRIGARHCMGTDRSLFLLLLYFDVLRLFVQLTKVDYAVHVTSVKISLSMRKRKASAKNEADPVLEDLLQNLHGSGDGGLHQVDGGETEPKTLGDVSKQSVCKLLDRVGVRRAASKKRQLEQEQQFGNKRRKGKGKVYSEDDLLYQRTVTSASAPICGAIAKTSRDAELSDDNNISDEPNGLESLDGEPGHRSEVPEDLELRSNEGDDEEDFEWEQGEGAYAAGSTPDGEGGKENGWTGDITIQVEEKPEKRKSAQGKPPVRRANARDKEFAELVHKAHLLCLLARGRMVEAACDDPLLQAAILSVLPSSISLLGTSGGSGTILLRSFVSWFSTAFRIVPLENIGSEQEKSIPSRLLEVAQQQRGTAEEVAAVSVAFLRGLGFTTRYVASLDVAPLKPDASSLEASAGWDPKLEGEGIIYSAPNDLEAVKATSLARLLAKSAFQQLSGSNSQLTSNTVPTSRGPEKMVSSDVGRLKNEDSGNGSYVQKGDNGRGKKLEAESTEEGKAEVKAYTRRKRKGAGHGAGSESADAANENVGRRSSGNKGEEEFETQVALALCATAAVGMQTNSSNKKTPMPNTPLAVRRLNGMVGQKKKGEGRLARKVGLSSRGESSNKNVPENRMGAPLHWAEVYMVEENSGRWVHVDAARGWFNGADQVEGAAVAGRVPLRYAIAFAGSGAKDVTRRYIGMWSSVSALRVDEGWWSSTLHPLKQLEAAAIAGAALRQVQSQNLASSSHEAEKKDVPKVNHSQVDSELQKRLPIKSDDKAGPSSQTVTGKRTTRSSHSRRNVSSKKVAASFAEPASHFPVDRSALEDMELQTKTYTEPLPTNQQAYKSHHLYCLERWLTKYQVLHPKGPVLGYCAGQPVYPRTCVQMLHTPDRWLREGLKVREGEVAAKIVKANHLAGKSVKQAAMEVDGDEEKPPPPTTELFGKWQCDPWRPPRAENGIVPKNERGQVDCWSEYCIPPGTVHLRYPRLVPIVKRLCIDYAPAMVGFEIRKRRSVPMYEGVVVCEEFKDVIMDAYRQEEEIRYGQLRRKREEMAIRRWRELLHSMATRERLKAAYEGFPHGRNEKATPKKVVTQTSKPRDDSTRRKQKEEVAHVHHFPEQDQTYDEETGTRTKVCSCGFTVHVEEM
ncbi:hypothetical protein R1flu_010375 [Riccia fluitans]|uniref:Uncharacterized protein n=1 Tax=Riccia fluitans TaxID=41844 RepID=A0ABD1Z4W4_9MARC